MAGDDFRGVLDGAKIQLNGSMSDSDAAMVRKRLRIHVVADIRKMSAVLEEVTLLCDKLMTWATIEIAIEDLTDMNKEL